MSWIGALGGALLYVLSYKLFIVPLYLYIGGYPGIAQIISNLITESLHINVDFDLTGVILWIANIPMFVLASKIVNRQFFIKSIVTVLFMSVTISSIPVPSIPIINDTLTSCIVGGALSGTGVGIMLRNGSCGGGLDILGLYFAKKYPTFSVGQIAIIINFFVYTYSAFRENLQIAVYSLIFALVAAMVTDKLHYQNIETCAIIISKVAGIERPIIDKMKRGVTLWKGFGGYHMENSYIYMTMISKYEINYLEQQVKALDPQAFIVLDENRRTIGNFEKRFDI
jgi:uncharacterized membrane-anchored protein YitT (DUF2179 family)